MALQLNVVAKTLLVENAQVVDNIEDSRGPPGWTIIASSLLNRSLIHIMIVHCSHRTHLVVRLLQARGVMCWLFEAQADEIRLPRILNRLRILLVQIGLLASQMGCQCKTPIEAPFLAFQSVIESLWTREIAEQILGLTLWTHTANVLYSG